MWFSGRLGGRSNRETRGWTERSSYSAIGSTHHQHRLATNRQSWGGGGVVLSWGWRAQHRMCLWKYSGLKQGKQYQGILCWIGLVICRGRLYCMISHDLPDQKGVVYSRGGRGGKGSCCKLEKINIKILWMIGPSLFHMLIRAKIFYAKYVLLVCSEFSPK